MRLISITFTAIFIISFIFYLYFSSKRKTLKNIYSLGANLITFVETFIVTKLLVNIFGNNISKTFSSFLLKEEEWVKMDAATDFVKFLSTIILGVLIFYLIYVILYFINHLLKRIIFKKVTKSSYKLYEPKKKDIKLVNIGIGIVSFLITTFAILFPFGAMVKVVDYASKRTEYNGPSEFYILTDNAVLKAYSYVGSEPFFNNVTVMNDKKEINSTRELKAMLSIVFAFLEAKEDNTKELDTVIFKEELTETYLVPSFLSELCSNAAARFKNNQSFLGVTLDIPTDKSRQLYLDTLEVISNWERENLISDIETTFEIYSLLEDNNVKDIEDTDSLLIAMEKDEFSEELFLSLFHNQDFKKLIPSFMNFGVDTLLETVNISSSGNYVNTIDFSKMTDDEIRKEAQIFSLALRDIKQISNLDASTVTYDEINKIANDLNRIKESKLLSDILYNVIYKLLEAI